MNLYQEKDQSYFSTVRKDLISLLGDQKFDRVLEIGAGNGAGLIHLLENGIAKDVNGIDLNEVDGFQKDSRVSNFWLGNIEEEDFGIEPASFDCIICADVLEHLVDPWSVMNKIYSWMKPGGLFILSIPKQL